MSDTYKNYRDLTKQQRIDVDYCIHEINLGTPEVIMAPHGGKIELHTSSLALEVARSSDGVTPAYSYYAFEGIRKTNNKVLHIVSTRFDEPRALKLLANADVVVAFHGQACKRQSFVMLGGLNAQLKRNIERDLTHAGFDVKTPTSGLGAIDPNNICNRCRLGGVQLELSLGLRRQLAGNNERRRQFIQAIRGSLARYRPFVACAPRR